MRNSPSDPDAALRKAVATGLREIARRAGSPVPKVRLGYSGGLDSSLLLHLLAEERELGGLSLSALHVHHGLSPNADEWSAHCERVCAGLDVELEVVRVQVPRDAGQSLEEQARNVRYAMLRRDHAGAIALAHHADDQAETLLLQMLRGAGPRGLSGMPELTPDTGVAENPRYWRPLLRHPRTALFDAASRRGIVWIEDESNQDDGFRRNFLRHRIFPALADAFPAYPATLGRVAANQAQAAELLDVLADIDLAATQRDNGLDCMRLTGLSRVRTANTLRRWLNRRGMRAPSAARLDALVDAVFASTNDTRLRWEHESICVVRRKALLLIEART